MKRVTASFAIILILLFVLVWLNINSGSINISLSEIFDILSRTAEESTAYHIVWDIRLPRIIAALLLGGALSVSGFMLQTFFSNPIAGPYVLGISSGAKLTVALTMIFLLGKGIVISSWTMVVAAFAGSLISMGFVLAVSSRVKKMSMLVVCGIMIGYICSAVTDLVVTFADDSNIVNLHNWSQGSFSGISWGNIQVMGIIVFVAFMAAFLLSKPISAYRMGEVYAQNMGVNVKMLRVLLILISSLLSACVTAFAGPISFVGMQFLILLKWQPKQASL